LGPWVAAFVGHTTPAIGMGLGMPNGAILGSGNVSATTAPPDRPRRRGPPALGRARPAELYSRPAALFPAAHLAQVTA